MNYVATVTRQKTLEAQGWVLLLDLLTKANLTEEQWFSVHLALGFPVMAEKEIGERLQKARVQSL